MSYPKIELHVHLEGTVRPAALLRFARRNGVALPADSVEELARIYEFHDFRHFLDVWWMTTGALLTESDFRQVVVDYAAEAASHGAVYLEGIFSPSEPASRGVSYEEVFAGYCDGAQQAWESHGVRVRLTPDIVRGFPVEAADETVRYAIANAGRGIVGIGLGGPEGEYPPQLYQRAFARARDGGLGSVPHAGEADGPASVRGALEYSALTGSGMASARRRTGACCASWPTAARCLTSARFLTCAPAWSAHWPSIRCRSCWPPESKPRSTRMIRPCSGTTSAPSMRRHCVSGRRPCSATPRA
ncbi:MAG TPA: hypothetical protein VF983_02540 [Streptosporangiaceae bacterium]